MDIAKFRADFPEFEDVGKYPNAMINRWGATGEKLLSPNRWGDLYIEGLFLFVAHNLALSLSNKEASISGAQPGKASGAVSSKSVGAVSISYDTSSTMEPNAGHWNETTYGKEYIRLVRLIGAIVYQV